MVAAFRAESSGVYANHNWQLYLACKCVSKAKEKALHLLVLHTFNFQDEVLILQEHLTNFKTEEIGWDGFNLFLFVY